MSRIISQKEVEEKKYFVVDGDVFDLKNFYNVHPGGKQILINAAGKDVTDIFHMFHNPSVMAKYKDKLKIGTLEGYSPVERMSVPGSFGDMVPYGDPLWYQRFNSPYYKETHRKFRERVRAFVDKEIMPAYREWREGAKPPSEVYAKMGKEGFLACMLGPPFPADYVDAGTPVPEDFDYFHEMILYDEVSRCGNSAVVAALTNGPAIAISAVWRFGTAEQKRKFLPDILMGRKYCALAISEPGAGSDVANLTCTAKKQGEGYVVNGNKKWITNGMYAEVFVTGVVTGKPGQGGLSLMLVTTDMAGFSVRKINIRGSDLSGTAYLDFDNVFVPVGNLIGKENDGFKQIMFNFNHERFYVNTCMVRMARVCIEECIKYALRRKTFGKYLHEHQAVRMKVAAMIRRVEALAAWLESLVYQMNTMTHAEASLKLGDVMCLCKAEASKVLEFCARETTMIFGGNSLHVGSVGDKIETMVPQVKAYQIPAGAEDIMDDFGARTAFKLAKMFAKI